MQDSQPVVHHRDPGRVTVVVLIWNRTAISVVWRIDIDALYCFAVPILNELEGLKILAMNQNALRCCGLIVDPFQDGGLEQVREKLRVHNQVAVSPEEINRQWL